MAKTIMKLWKDSALKKLLKDYKGAYLKVLDTLMYSTPIEKAIWWIEICKFQLAERKN